MKQFYRRFNKADWPGCHAFIDLQIIRKGKVNLIDYTKLMQGFKEVYGGVKPWMTRLSLHLDSTSNQSDKRPFAYVYVVWQDNAHGFHLFRERWIKENGQWFTRVVGLVPNRQEMESRRD